jgi:hypothetical protein
MNDYCRNLIIRVPAQAATPEVRIFTIRAEPT